MELPTPTAVIRYCLSQSRIPGRTPEKATCPKGPQRLACPGPVSAQPRRGFPAAHPNNLAQARGEPFSVLGQRPPLHRPPCLQPRPPLGSPRMLPSLLPGKAF